jgi:hypothetical protein
MIPDSSWGRVVAFGSMVFLAGTQIFGRILACALLAATSGTLLVLFMTVEMGFYILFKLLRRDFTYWFPIESAAVSAGISMTARLVVKVLADVTGLIQAR